MPEIWAEIQLLASLMKINGKVHSWTIYQYCLPRITGRWSQKNVGRVRDGHFNSLTLLVPNLDMEGLPVPERNRLASPKYLGTIFEMNQIQSPTPTEPISSFQLLRSGSPLRMACVGQQERKERFRHVSWYTVECLAASGNHCPEGQGP